MPLRFSQAPLAIVSPSLLKIPLDPATRSQGRVISVGTYLIRASLSPPRTWLANHKEPAELSSQHVPGIRRDRAVRLLAEWRNPNPLMMLELANIPT